MTGMTAAGQPRAPPMLPPVPGSPKNTSQKMSPLARVDAPTCESGPPGAATTDQEHLMKDTTTKPTLALRAHSIRDLTAAELRAAQGGCSEERCCASQCSRRSGNE